MLEQVAAGVSGGYLAVLQSLRRRATEGGLPIYLVGGPVRDALLGVPVKDLDFVLIGDAPELAEELASELGGAVTVHPRFGTATVEVQGDRVDMVTARKETYPHPGSLPVVSASGLEDDLARRDFSINAMALPLAGDSAPVVDPHGGLQDLGDGLVRILHPQSFADDPTRMLRAVRYQVRLGFEIADSTQSDLNATLAEGHVSAVTGDRWRQDLEKIFQEQRAAAMLSTAMALGILPAIHPALCDGSGLNRMADTEGLGPVDYLAALFMPLRSADGEATAQRLNLPTAWLRVVRDTIALKDLAPSLTGVNVAPSAVCRALDGLDTDAVAASVRLVSDPEVAGRLRRYLDEWRLVVPALSGNDLLAMGVPAGPKVGETLQELTATKLDGLVDTEGQERALVERIISRGS